MSVRSFILALGREVGRVVRQGRHVVSLAAVLGTAVAASSASAGLFLSFPSQTVVADGISATPVSILVSVNNTESSALDVIAFTGQFNWTASGGPVDTDLIRIADNGTASSSGMLFAPVNGIFDMDGGTSEPANFSVSGTSLDPVSMSLGSTPLALINLSVAAGITQGQFALNFVTGSPSLNAFSLSDSSPFQYSNGNNNSTLGVITVVPESSASVLLASGAVMVSGAGVARRRNRSRKNGVRSAEIVG